MLFRSDSTAQIPAILDDGLISWLRSPACRSHLGSLDCPPHPAPLLSALSFYLPHRPACPGGVSSMERLPLPAWLGLAEPGYHPSGPRVGRRGSHTGSSANPGRPLSNVQITSPCPGAQAKIKRGYVFKALTGAHTAARLSLSGGDGEETHRQRAPAILEGDSGAHPATSNGPARELIGTWGGQ